MSTDIQMYRKQESCKSDNTSCLGKIYRKAEDIRHVRGNKAIYQKRKRNDRKNLWNSKRIPWISIYTIHRKSTDGNESRAYFCMYESKKLARFLGKNGLLNGQKRRFLRNFWIQFNFKREKWCWDDPST